MSILCSMVGATFGVAAAAEVIRYKKGITAIGNAQIDTAQSKFGGSSYLGDGSGDYLNVYSNGAFAYSGDFTIECWVRVNSLSSARVIFSQNTLGNLMSVYANTDGSLIYYVSSAGRITTSSNAITTNTWYHVALSRSGTSTKLFVNGTQVGSTYTDNNSYTDGLFYIGSWNDGSSSWSGHIDEFRVSNTARYTANFTAPTAPFVNDDNTLLLIHADGTDASTFFEDDNGVRSKRSIISISGAEIDTAQSKFGGSSLLMPNDGSKYLSVAHSADFLTGTGAFTVEGWFRPLSAVDPGDGVGSRFFYFKGINTAGGIGLGISTDGIRFRGPSADDLAYTGTVSNSTFSHIAFVWDGTNKSIYLNGSRVATNTNAINVTDTSNIVIGYNSIRFGYNGHIDELRHSNVARYSGTTYTTPTTQFQNDANTLMLLHFDATDASTVFIDDNGTRSPKGVIANGNAQIDTAQSKFGGSSALFDGTSDYLTVSSGGFNVGTGDITIEFWVRHNAINDQQVYCDLRTGANNHYIFYVQSDNKLVVYDGGTTYTSTATMAANTWYHLALSRSGTTLKVFRDGTEVISGSNSRNLSDNSTIVIGSSYDAFSTNSVNGWIDEFRISNTARYTANFTAPTAQFQNDSNTLLLLHMDGTDASTVFFDDNGKTPT